VGPWPEPSVDKKKCVASSTNLNQFGFFESNDTSKPFPAASKYSDPDETFAYFEKLELFDPAEVGTSKWPPDPGEVGTFKCPPIPGVVGAFEWAPDPGRAGSFKRPPDEAVTKEVTVGPWPEPSVDKKKCVASSTNLNQFNFFESNGTSKPSPAASKYSDPDAGFAYFGNLELFDPAEVETSKWPPDPGVVGTFKRPPDSDAVGTSEWPPDPGAVGTFERAPDPGGCLGA
jgi:hypothetical protein